MSSFGRGSVALVTIHCVPFRSTVCSDDDMQSTYSAVSIGGGSLQFDEDDEDEVNEAEATSTRR